MEHAREQGSKGLAGIAAQSAWARRLAIALARDVQAGEDLAQEAMLASLRHQPSGNARSWLARVLRNLARLRRRSEGRRDAREREAARTDSPDDPALVLQRIELQESLLGAVRALPEPYRNTILLRWFEELEPEEIARRTDTPVRTVHTRLQRALALLREELDRRSQGDRSRWLAAWLPLVPPPHSPLPWALAMQAKTKLVIAAVSLAAVASLWIALRPVEHNAGEIAAPLAQEKLALGTESGVAGADGSTRGGSDRALLNTQATPAVAAAATAGELSVRSSVGLELPFLEWQTPLGDWMRRDLTQGRCATNDMTLPCRVRAPGHVPVNAKDGDELVLEPDELLILEGHDLRSCTNSIRIGWPYRYEGDPNYSMSDSILSACTSGYLSADKWAMAVSHDLIRRSVHEGEAEAVVIWRDQHRADVHLHPVAGARGHWTIPCEGRPACGPLVLRVERPSGIPAGRVLLKLEHSRDGDSDPVKPMVFEWGDVLVHPNNNLWADDAYVEATASDYTYDALQLGEPLLVSARDESSGAFGRLVFDHDGSSRTLTMRPGFEVVARLVSDVDSSPVTSARLWWTFPDGKEQVWGWSGDTAATVTRNDGVFRQFLPQKPLLRAEEPLDPPPQLIVHVEAPGYESFEKQFETGSAQRLDCGDLRLAPSVGQIVLAPGHGLLPKVVEWSGLRVSTHPDIQWNVRNAALGSDGSMSIFLVRSENSTQAKRLFDVSSFSNESQRNALWPAEPSRWLMLYVLNISEGDLGGERLFERQADGRYAAVPRSERELVVECGALPPQDQPNARWHVGWMWQGQWGLIGSGSAQVGMVDRMRVTFPSGGASIYWSAKGPPPGVLGAPANVGGSIPVEEIHGKLVLK